jgi:hypothetical protein
VVSLGSSEVTVIARVLCATAQSEQAAMTMAALWGEQVGWFERTAPRPGPGDQRPDRRAAPAAGRRALPGSPLQPGATVYVAEAPGGSWLHVRIDHRECSIPVGVAQSVLIEVPRVEQPPSARDAYAVLVSRLDRRSWRVRAIDRASGVVAASEWFEDEADAPRRRHHELSSAADALDAAAFRARYRLP